MPRGIPTSTIEKPDLVKILCDKINIQVNTVYNPSNGTITIELLQEVCNYLGLNNMLSKQESAKLICEKLNLRCTNIDFNPTDGTISAGFIEKIINNISIL